MNADMRFSLVFHRVNHWPGITLTIKSSLMDIIKKMQTEFGFKDYDYVPMTFTLPDEYADFEKAWEGRGGTKQLWLTKGKSHRKIQIRDTMLHPKEIESVDALVQEYVHPHLIDGKMWDIGIYVAVFSGSPLRIYAFNDWLIRERHRC